MKKIIVICVFSLVANFALFAQKQVVQSLHFSAPIKAQVWEGNKNDFYYKDCIGNEKNNDVLFAGVDFNWNRMTVNESGFSFLIGLGLGYTIENSNDSDALDGRRGFDSEVKIGWGVAPIRSEKMIFALHGFIAFNYKFLSDTEDVYYDGYKSSIDYDIPCFTSEIGIDAVFIYHLSERFGLFSGLDISTALFGFSTVHMSEDYFSDTFPMDISGKINAVPRFGFCWIF